MTTRTSAGAAQRRVLVVLGMHRSGTSALTRILNLLGVELGGPLLPPQPDNQTGFWEHADAVALDERLFAALGSSWQDPRPLPAKWWESGAARALRAEAVAILRSGLGAAPLVGLKDPRLCRLLPFWLPAFDEAKLAPAFVILTRDPAAVAASLEARDHIGPWKAHLLWLEYLLAAEELTRRHARVFVDYERMAADWRACASRIAQGLGVQWPVPPEQAAGQIEGFLRPAVRALAPDKAHPAYVDWTRDPYQSLVAGDTRAFAPLRSRLEAARATLEALLER
jgi:O-antigen biosynthesis protein